jgi:hypothetical protein
MRSLLCIFIIAALWTISCYSASPGNEKGQNATDPQNQTEPDEQDPFQESVEEFPGPFMIKRLPYRIVADESEPDYFGILGVSRSSTLAKIRASFRKSSRDFRDVLMYFRSPPNYSRMNLTKSTKDGAKASKTRLSPRSHLRPKIMFNETVARLNTSNDSATDENKSHAEEKKKAAEKAAKAAEKRALDQKKRLEDFKSRTEAYRILTNPRYPTRFGLSLPFSPCIVLHAGVEKQDTTLIGEHRIEERRFALKCVNSVGSKGQTIAILPSQ